MNVFNYRIYGEFSCSKCGKPLYSCTVIAQDEDDDGNEWRMFCPECTKDMLLKDAERLYKDFSTAQRVPEVQEEESYFIKFAKTEDSTNPTYTFIRAKDAQDAMLKAKGIYPDLSILDCKKEKYND